MPTTRIPDVIYDHYPPGAVAWVHQGSRHNRGLYTVVLMDGAQHQWISGRWSSDGRAPRHWQRLSINAGPRSWRWSIVVEAGAGPKIPPGIEPAW